MDMIIKEALKSVAIHVGGLAYVTVMVTLLFAPPFTLPATGIHPGWILPIWFACIGVAIFIGEIVTKGIMPKIFN